MEKLPLVDLNQAIENFKAKKEQNPVLLTEDKEIVAVLISYPDYQELVRGYSQGK